MRACVVAGICGLLLCAAAGSPAPTFAQVALPEAPGRDITVKLCGNCHGSETVASVRHSPEGWREVSFEVPGRPSFAAVGQNLYTPDGTKLIVTAINPGKGGGHVVEANVRVTHRLALCLFPTRMEQSYALDRTAVERVVLQATGYAPSRFEPSEKEWVVVN